MSVKKIAVIGAGVLGLSVARSLAQQGAKVTVFERSHVGAGTSSTTLPGLIQMAKHQKVIIISMPWRLTSISGYNRNGPQKVIG